MIKLWRIFFPALLAVSLLAGLMTAGGCARPTPPGTAWLPVQSLAADSLRYCLVCRHAPRPLRIHHLRIDLRDPRLELAAVLAPEAVGQGPATAVLEAPLSLARRSSALALVNANPWQGMADASGKRPTNWHEGMAVEILGLAATQGTLRSRPADPGHCSVWIDAYGQLHLGRPDDLAKVREGLAGFSQLLRDRRMVPAPGGPIHPRTALGTDAAGRYLYLVVVDGRQAGYSEGMSYFELAAYMRDLGCQDAVNLDGGGSSVMILAESSGQYRVANDPSTKVHGVSVLRPIPVALVVRSRQTGPPRQVEGP